jgi:hypothetical protein
MRKKPGIRRTYFWSGPLPDRAITGDVTDVTSGQKTPLGRKLRSRDWRHFRWRDLRHFGHAQWSDLPHDPRKYGLSCAHILLTYVRSVAFSGYSVFLDQYNYIAESGAKHHNPNPYSLFPNWRVSLSKICHERPNNAVTHKCPQCTIMFNNVYLSYYGLIHGWLNELGSWIT